MFLWDTACIPRLPFAFGRYHFLSVLLKGSRFLFVLFAYLWSPRVRASPLKPDWGLTAGWRLEVLPQFTLYAIISISSAP